MRTETRFAGSSLMSGAMDPARRRHEDGLDAAARAFCAFIGWEP